MNREKMHTLTHIFSSLSLTTAREPFPSPVAGLFGKDEKISFENEKICGKNLPVSSILGILEINERDHSEVCTSCRMRNLPSGANGTRLDRRRKQPFNVFVPLHQHAGSTGAPPM